MGGRGSKSKTSSSAGNERRRRRERVQTDHLAPEEVPKTPEDTAAYLGVSVEQAKELYGSVNAYTGSQYKDMRAAQRGELDSEHYRRMASNLETYIDEAPKWAGGTTYRGLNLDQETAATLLKDWNKGATIDINGGTASWSTRLGVSENFADYYGKSAKLVFSCKTQRRGTSVKHISQHSLENEVLVSKDVRYRVVGTPKSKGGYTYIEVEEV